MEIHHSSYKLLRSFLHSSNILHYLETEKENGDNSRSVGRSLVPERNSISRDQISEGKYIGIPSTCAVPYVSIVVICCTFSFWIFFLGHDRGTPNMLH